MRKISKGEECAQLRTWKRKNPNGDYKDVDDITRRHIRQSLLSEQFGLCAYCCQQINLENSHNEHLLAQSVRNSITLEHKNLIASCNIKRQCGDAHGAAILELTPLMDECEEELRFKLSGRVEAITKRAEDTVRILNLGDTEKNNKALISRRKAVCEALIWKDFSVPPDQLKSEDEDLIELLYTDLSDPKDGKLQPFAPILRNILRNR